MDRKGLEEKIKERAQDGRLPCALCFKIVEKFGVSNKEAGEILNGMKVKISAPSRNVLDNFPLDTENHLNIIIGT